MRDKNSYGQEFVIAPNQSTPPGTGILHGVWVNAGEEVEWIWTHDSGGSYISGYNIKMKEEHLKHEHKN